MEVPSRLQDARLELKSARGDVRCAPWMTLATSAISSLAARPAEVGVVDVVELPPRVTPVARVQRERDEEERAVAPRRDTASFSAEALAKLAAECGECAG